jgi:hypothetical protein
MYMHVFIYTNYIYIQYVYIYTSNLHSIWGRQNIELDEVIEIFMDRIRTRRISVVFEDEPMNWISPVGRVS